MNKLKKRSIFIIGSLFALISSYVLGSNSYSVTIDSSKIIPETAHADIAAGSPGYTGDCGDGGDGGSCH